MQQNCWMSRWSWIPYVGGEGGSQTPELTVQLQVEGEHLSGLQQGRLLAYGSTWCPVRIVDAHQHVKDSLANRAAANASTAEEGSIHAGPLGRLGTLGWLQKRLTREAEDGALAAEARLPSAIALQVNWMVLLLSNGTAARTSLSQIYGTTVDCIV